MSRIASAGGSRQREPRVRDRAHLGKVARLPCVACLVRGSVVRPVEVAHVKIGYPEEGWRAFGHSEKAHDWRTAPLCSSCHRTGPGGQHQNAGGDERSWWEQLGIFPPAFCEALVGAFSRGEDGLKVCRAFAVDARARRALTST